MGLGRSSRECSRSPKSFPGQLSDLDRARCGADGRRRCRFGIVAGGRALCFTLASALSCAGGYFVYRGLGRGHAERGAAQRTKPLDARDPRRGVRGAIKRRGKVRLGDGVWLASGPELAEGTPVVVTAVQGTRLVVEPLRTAGWHNRRAARRVQALSTSTSSAVVERRDPQQSLVADRGAVARVEADAVDLDRADRRDQIGVPARPSAYSVVSPAFSRRARAPARRCGSAGRRRRPACRWPGSRTGRRGRPSGTAGAPAGRAARSVGSIQIWKTVVVSGSQVVLGVADAGAGAHDLDVAGLGAALVAQAVLVGDRALADVGDDLHVGVRVRREAGVRRRSRRRSRPGSRPSPSARGRGNWRTRSGGGLRASRWRLAAEARRRVGVRSSDHARVGISPDMVIRHASREGELLACGNPALPDGQAISRRHPPLTSGSASLRLAARRPPAAGGAMRPSAQHRGAAHQRRGVIEAAGAPLRPLGDGQGALPIAISTLRRKRSRPMRLTAVPANIVRKPASSSAGQFGEARRGQLGARQEVGLGGGGRICSTGRRRGNRRSRRCGCRSAAAIRAGSAPCARSSDTRCSAGHRADRAPERRRSGRRRDSGGTAAMVAFGASGVERQAQIDLAEEQPGAELARHEVGVLALPAEAGLLGQRLLHDRRGVDKHLQLARPARQRSSAPALSAAF